MNRWKAAGAHLLVTLLVVTVIAVWVLTVWFPPALLPMSGILGLIVLIASVDVTLGPALTLAVFKPGKPGLKVDLAVIALLQIGMLCYGLYVLAQNRPVFVVASDNGLHLVVAADLQAEALADAPEGWRALPWTGPEWVGIRPPATAEERDARLFEWMQGKGAHLQPKYFASFDEVWPTLRERSAGPVAELVPYLDAGQMRRLQSAAGEADPATLRYVPIVNALGAGAMVLIGDDGRPGEFVAIDSAYVGSDQRSED